MASGENLGAKFTIDITDLKAGLTQANRLIRESESEFIEAAAGMDDWETSTEGLTKRIKTLNKQVDIQQEKVNALVKEKERIIKAMKDEGKSNEEIEKAVDAVNKSIQREGKQLDNLKKKLKQSENNLDKFESASDDAADALEDMGDEAGDTRDATEKLTDEIEEQKKELDKLTREYSNAVIEQGEFSDEAKRLKKDIKNLNDELEDNEKQLEGATSGLSGLGKGAKSAGGGFDLAKVAVGGFVAGGLAALAGAAGNAVSSMLDLAESTRETRTDMAKLKTAFESAGLSADDASETFKTLYGILGDEGQATEAAAFLAKYADDEKELAEQTRILTGVFAEYGESIPTEGLAEGIAATIEMGEVQGVLADALEWQGINLDDFNEKLGKLKTEKEREALITETLIGLYGESADAFIENNAAVIEAQEKTAELNTAMANLGGKVEPAKTALTSLKTELVEFVTPAVGALSEGFASLVTSLIEGAPATDLLTESQRNSVTAAQEAAAAYTANKEAADEMAAANLANVDYAEQLIKKLDLVVDSNGKVKAGEEERAAFILEELNAALGTEYDSLNQIVDANGQIKQSVYDVIEAKKAQILLAAYEDVYKQAIMGVAEQEAARAIQAQELAAQEAVVAEARQNLTDLTTEMAEAIVNAKGYEAEQIEKSYGRQITAAYGELWAQEEILADKQEAFNETDAKADEMNTHIQGYEQATTLIMQGETDKAIEILEDLADGHLDAASSVKEATDKKKKELEQQVIDTEINAQLMRAKYEAGVEGVTEEMVKTAEDAAETAKKEFKEIGGNITEGIGEGAEGKKWTLSKKMGNLISAAVSAAKKAAGIESPSKLFKAEVGQYIGEGVAVGVEDSTRDVVKAIDGQVEAALKAYDVGEINAAVSNGINTSTTNKNGSDRLASASNSGVTVYQTNNYSQAHSRYELYKSKQATEAAVRLAIGGT